MLEITKLTRTVHRYKNTSLLYATLDNGEYLGVSQVTLPNHILCLIVATEKCPSGGVALVSIRELLDNYSNAVPYTEWIYNYPDTEVSFPERYSMTKTPKFHTYVGEFQ